MIEGRVCNQVKRFPSQCIKLPSGPQPTLSHNPTILSFDWIFCSYQRQTLISRYQTQSCHLLHLYSASSDLISSHLCASIYLHFPAPASFGACRHSELGKTLPTYCRYVIRVIVFTTGRYHVSIAENEMIESDIELLCNLVDLGARSKTLL